MPVPPINYDTAERQTLDEIREWHGGMVDALVDQRAAVLRAIREVSTVASRFIGLTEPDVDNYYDIQRRELDRLTMLNLVASAEATITIDYFRRVGQRLKDPLALAYQSWHKKLSRRKQLRPNFDEDGILDVLKETHLVNNHVVGQYRECLQGRHWLGHGRRWERPIAVDQFDPEDVYDRAAALLRAIPM